MAVTSFAALLDAVPMVPTTAFRNTFYPATTVLQTRVHNLETGNIEQWDGTTWNTIFEGAGSATGGILYAGASAPNGSQVGHPGDGYVQLISGTVTLFWLKQSGTATNTGWQALAATGTGSPEGVVAAPVGVPYAQTDGGTGNVAWVKNSGTGTTGWRLVSTGQVIYNVLDYGATGNGVTDDTTAIQAALTAASAAGGKVVVPAGTYKVTTTLTLTGNGVTFEGAGRGNTTLVWAGGATAMLTLGAPTVPIYRWQVRGLALNDPTSAATYGAYLDFAREGVMEDVWLHQGFTNTALYLAGTSTDGNWTNRFTRVTVDSCAGVGTYCGPQTNAVMFVGCNWTSCAGDHVQFGQAQGVKFIGCQFEQAGSGYEIHANGGASGDRLLNCSWTDCYFELKSGTAGARAFYFENSGGHSLTIEELQVSGCFLWGQGTATYLLESNVTSGGCRGLIWNCGCYGATTAALKATVSGDLLTIIGFRALTGYGTGSTVPLLDNTSGAAANAASWLVGGGITTISGKWLAQRFQGSGTAHVAGDYALSGGWGTTASVSAVSAKDTGGRVTVTSAGTGQAANPTVTLTWKDGTWTTIPAVVASRGDSVNPSGPFGVTTPTATTCVFTFNGTPVAGSSYILDFVAMGK